MRLHQNLSLQIFLWGGNFSFDEQGVFYQTATLYGYVKKDDVLVSYKVLMAVLNSRLCWFYAKYWNSYVWWILSL